jgi:hypothetical protein
MESIVRYICFDSKSKNKSSIIAEYSFPIISTNTKFPTAAPIPLSTNEIYISSLASNILPLPSSINPILFSYKVTDFFFIPSPTYIFGIDITFALPLKYLSVAVIADVYLLLLLPILINGLSSCPF